MEWILKNLELILWIAGPIAVWINQRARQKRGQAADYDEDGIPEIAPSLAPPADDVAREARARRIQRELMRQLQQNQSQTPSPPPPPTPAAETMLCACVRAIRASVAAVRAAIRSCSGETLCANSRCSRARFELAS